MGKFAKMSREDEEAYVAKRAAALAKEASDDELAKAADELAEERTRIRLEQNAVNAVLEIRARNSGLSGAARRIVELNLEGAVSSTGQAEGARS